MEKKMKIKFDAYTKDVAAAASAFSSLYNYSPDITITKNAWYDGAINVHGEIDSSHLVILEKAMPDGTFSEDADKL